MSGPTKRSGMDYDAVRQAIKDAGGIGGQAQLAQRWGVSKQYVSQLAADETFPAPIGRAGVSDAWLMGACDEWKRAHDERG